MMYSELSSVFLLNCKIPLQVVPKPTPEWRGVPFCAFTSIIEWFFSLTVCALFIWCLRTGRMSYHRMPYVYKIEIILNSSVSLRDLSWIEGNAKYRDLIFWTMFPQIVCTTANELMLLGPFRTKEYLRDSREYCTSDVILLLITNPVSVLVGRGIARNGMPIQRLFHGGFRLWPM